MMVQRIGLLLLVLASTNSGAATVYSPVDAPQVVGGAPYPWNSTFTIVTTLDTPTTRFPHAWGTLTGVFVEFLTATGNQQAEGVSSGGIGTLFMRTRPILQLRGTTNANLAQALPTIAASPLLTGLVSSTNPVSPDMYSQNFAPPEVNSVTLAVLSNFWDDYFYDDSIYDVHFRTSTHLTLNGNTNLSLSGISTLNVTQRLRYEFDAAPAYASAGSPLIIGASVPVPGVVYLFGLAAVAVLRRVSSQARPFSRVHA